MQASQRVGSALTGAGSELTCETFNCRKLE